MSRKRWIWMGAFAAAALVIAFLGVKVSDGLTYVHIATGYTGTVAFVSDDPLATPGNGLPANYTFGAGAGGLHTFANIVLKTVGTHFVRVTDTANGAITGSETGIVVVNAPADHFEVTGIPSPIIAGTPSPVTVTAKDKFDNIVTNFAGTISFSSSDPGGTVPAPYTFSGTEGGTVTLNSVIFSCNDPRPGYHTVNAMQASPFVYGSQTDIAVIGPNCPPTPTPP